MVARATESFAGSVHQYARTLIQAVQASRRVRLGDVFAVSLAEGLLDAEIGPVSLRYILDPSIDVLQRRLEHHVARGEMIKCDTRAAALMLLSPLLLALLHQHQMGGRICSPVNLESLSEQICDAFLRAYTRSSTVHGSSSG